MFVSARYDRSDGFIIDENQALLVPELREVLKDPKLGPLAVAYIAISADPASPLADVFEDEKERLKEAGRWVLNEYPDQKNFIISSTKVEEAIAAYRKVCKTSAVILKQQYQKAAKKLGDYVEKKSSKLKDEDVKAFIDVMKEMPKVIDNYSQMNVDKKEDVEHTKTRVRGDKQLGYRASKLKKRR